MVANSPQFVANLPSPRFIKSHLPLELLPKQLNKIKPKILYVARNPKDVCVSLYHHSRVVHHLRLDFENWCELFLSGYAPCGDIIRHYLQSWEKRNDENYLFLKYEDMKKDTKATLCTIAKFMEKTLTEREYDSLCDFLSVEKMRENKACNFEPIVGKERYENSGVRFVRKGVAGDWKNHMTPEMSAKFDKWIEESTRGTGLTFS